MTTIQWTDETCRPCGATLTNENRVEQSRRLCKSCKNERCRARYVRKGRGHRHGWLKPTRDGDKKQARRRVNYLVEQGRIPNPNDLPCCDCGHLGSSKRHEYDHSKGYAGTNQLHVEAVCSGCHHAREESRKNG